VSGSTGAATGVGAVDVSSGRATVLGSFLLLAIGCRMMPVFLRDCFDVAGTDPGGPATSTGFDFRVGTDSDDPTETVSVDPAGTASVDPAGTATSKSLL